MTSASRNIVPFPKPQSAAPRAGTRVPAGGARDRRDAAVADRARDRRHDHRALLPGAGLGVVRQRRYRRHRAGQDHAERAHQADPAVRDRRRARHPRARRAERQGRRRSDRARPDDDGSRARPPARAISSRPKLDVARLRAALGESDDPLADFRPPQARAPALIEMQRQFLISQRPNSTPSSPRSTGSRRRRRRSARPSRRPSRSSRRRYRCCRSAWTSARPVRQGTGFEAASISQTLPGSWSSQQQDLLVQKSRLREADAAVAALERNAGAGRRGVSPHACSTSSRRPSRRPRACAGRDQGRAAHQAAALDRAGRRRRAAARGAYGRRRGDAGAGAAVVVPTTASSRSRPWSPTATSASCSRARKRRSRSTPSTSPATGFSMARCSACRRTPSRATSRRTASNDKAPGAETSTSEPKGQELVYAARVSLDRTEMQIDDNSSILSPGMAVTVEIKTGTRTMISYLLSPLLRYKQEACAKDNVSIHATLVEQGCAGGLRSPPGSRHGRSSAGTPSRQR